MSTLSDKFVYYWKLDETTGNYTDVIAGKVFTNTNVTHNSGGKIGYCAEYNGSNAKSVANTSNIGGTTWSMGVWVYAHNWNQHSTVFRKTSSGFIFRFGQTSGGILIAGAEGNKTTSTGVGLNNWHHVIVTCSPANKVIFYVDGAQFDTYATAITCITDSVNMGYGGEGTEWFDGLFDEPFMCNAELTSAEVSTLYNGGAGIQYPFRTAPTVTTQAVSSIDNTTATGNGNVTADGGATITERGVCIGATSNPTTAGTKFTSAGTTGAFTVSMTSLTKNTHYHARAYAINSIGTSYGADVEFDTTNAPAELRDFTNKPRAVYDANKTTVIYAEDLALIKAWIEYLNNK